jgi:predicted ATPase
VKPSSSTFVTRVVLKNYKSIADCDVSLRSLTFLVGPNGAGKSNFLDALRFVTDALRTSLDHALRERGGIKEVRRRSGGHPTHFSLQLEFQIGEAGRGRYGFRIGAQPRGGYEVQEEDCEIQTQIGEDGLFHKHFFKVRNGNVTSSVRVFPAASSDRLYLVNASGLPEFVYLYNAFSRMGFYSLNPARIRDLQPPDAGDLLDREGSNLASVLGRLSLEDNPAKQRIEDYLAKVVPGVHGVDAKVIGPRETLEFRQQVAGSPDPWRFLASNMSDGTLRALGILVALFQATNGGRLKVPLVGIEEPEVALHPAAAGVLLDSLRDASRKTQVVVTSHSPDLLDDKDLDTDSILAVLSEKGVTRIGPLDQAGKSALMDRLYTAGELLRLNQLVPENLKADESTQVEPDLGQQDLFGRQEN